MSWNLIPLEPVEIHLATVLRCGQSFRWKNIDNVFSIGMKGRVLFLQQTVEGIQYRAVKCTDNADTKELIRDYLNLDTSLKELQEQWCSKDPHLSKMLSSFAGVRMLRQDPWENLVSFICSTNNNVKRISQMVENLCLHFGDFIAEVDGIKYHEFPTPSQLVADNVETKLRQLGFGYRAKYIHKTAQIVNGSDPTLEKLTGLREAPYEDAHAALLEFSGVGPKVADCVCLMSLDKHDCVPVDTHVWQIAQRDYKIARRHKTMNKDAYAEVRTFFKQLWGEYAGWAHSTLFAADLRDLENGFTQITQQAATIKSEDTSVSISLAPPIKSEETSADSLPDQRDVLEPSTSPATKISRPSSMVQRRESKSLNKRPRLIDTKG